MEDNSAPIPTNYKFLNKTSKVLDFETSEDYDDEIVTFDSPTEDYAKNNPQILNFQINYAKIDTKYGSDEAENRPQTSNIINRYNTADFFAFEEDELCTKQSIHNRLIHIR
jgi:hypothetical protein